VSPITKLATKMTRAPIAQARVTGSFYAVGPHKGRPGERTDYDEVRA
jgi:hypothetical protein